MPKRRQSWERLLRRAIGLARETESHAPATSFRRPLQTVAYGSLVRNRRYAEAVLALGRPSAYEARATIRSMIEIWGNYRWVRLRQPHSRANRFVKSLALDHLRLLASLPASQKGPNHAALLRTLKRQRAQSRHLFRIRVTKAGKTKLEWARSWSKVSSFETRIQEIVTAAPPTRRAGDEAIYFYYRWFSAAVHGSPFSLSECIQDSPQGWRPRRQPERRPSASVAAATSCLSDTLLAACEDLCLAALRARAQALQDEVIRLGRLPRR